jgi:hypothetical protein
MVNIFTSGWVSDYIESTAREGSGQGLYYKVSFLQSLNIYRDSRCDNQDVEFVVFRNEQGQPEFAVEVKKDGKGMTATPWRK